MDTMRICKECRQALPANAPEGLCPACLAKVALGTEAAPGATTDIDPQAGQAPPGTRVPPAPAQLAGQFPQLELLELLGMGGMGMVYKARQPRLDRFVALKILPVDSAAHPSFAERFNREAKALAKLNHPGIVDVYDFGQTAQYYFFVMEYVDGMNLRRLLQTQTLEPRQALDIVVQICTALQYAHDEGVVHRDIKPENILLNKKGQVKIADFGLAKLLGAAPDTALTMSQAAMGTLNYMAPEQRQNAQKVDHRADIYSLGVVFYEMLTGEVPMGRFAPPSQKVQVDVRLDEVVLRALEREPARRYQQASEIKTDVQNMARAPSPAGAVAQPALLQPPTRKPWLAWVWWTLLVLVTLPFFLTAELNRAEGMAGHGPKYWMGGPWALVLVALGAFAVIKLLELRLARAGAATEPPFSQAWLAIIVAIFGACVLAIGPFPYVEWLHQTLKVFPTNVANASGATVELAGFSQTFVKHGFAFWEGRTIALIGVLSCAFVLVLPRRLRWNVARSVVLLGAGVAIMALAAEFEIHRPRDGMSNEPALDDQAKTDPRLRQFIEEFKRHKAAEAAAKNVPPEAMAKVGYSYGAAYFEYKPAHGYAVCWYAALALILLGAMTFRQAARSSPAAFAGWHRAVEAWSSLLLLGPCLISVLSAVTPGWWIENVAYIPLFDGQSWFGDWVQPSRLLLAGVDFWQGRLIAAVCIAAILVVIATALLRWRRGARAAMLSLAGLISIVCAIHLLKGNTQDSATVSWADFQAVAQHGLQAAASAETRRFLAEHPRYLGQLVKLDRNVQALAAKLAVPDPLEIAKTNVTKSADGKTTVTSITLPLTFLTEARHAQAQRLAQGGGVVGLYQNSTSGPQWPVLCGVGLVLLGIRDAYRTRRQVREHRNRKDRPNAPAFATVGQTEG
jgi:tRNA A-37 threonylcarbamoyl transferase component Bud32